MNFFPIRQSDEASRWRVRYQRGLPCLVYLIIEHNIAAQYVEHTVLRSLEQHYYSELVERIAKVNW